MKASIISNNAVDARALAEKKLGRHLHISSVFFLKNDPSKRLWVFSTELLG
jgi:hypothetical protein